MGLFSNYDDETNKLYGSLFNQLAGPVDSYKYQTQISQTLVTKRQRVGSTNEYIDSLINNVTYYVEMKKEIIKLLEKMFSTKTIPNSNSAEEEMRAFQLRIKAQVPSLVKLTKDTYNAKYSTNNQKVEALQFDYAYLSFGNDLLLTIVETLVLNPSFTNQLFRSSARYNIETLNGYLQTYTNLKLENIALTGKI